MGALCASGTQTNNAALEFFRFNIKNGSRFVILLSESEIIL